MSESPHVSLINDVFAHADEGDVKVKTGRISIGKVVCVGRNYAAHAQELGNEIPKSPILFMKPASSVAFMRNDIIRPDSDRYGDTHYEAELCIQLSADLSNATVAQAQQAIGSVTIGLDLTLRDLQTELKQKGHPWERAKCFDGACVLADWVDPQAFGDFSNVHYQLYINDELKQDGDSTLMLFPVYELLAEISHAFSLQAGDVIMTGTPSGVGILHAGDELKLVLGAHEWQTRVQ
ncbi:MULTISPECIES: fumarylacetoacetate hydrolase family protein [unclassified Psychrobacter]|uniref:fumarylacetoacetate hydrolase family protein n=1 Tax=unclassified Psychrobacter TaxID=196806 RepID=UPI0009EEA0F7|nr:MULTISPECIES: fumarylacetoacetate hydrolase family protein [unclassified Psychrobacter]